MTDHIDDGGPAFPIPGFHDEDGNPGRTSDPVPGMSLRAYIATHALNGLIVAYPDTGLEPKDFAHDALKFADALIRELNKRPTP